MSVDVRELRSGARYVVLEPVVGSFGSVSVSILNVAELGLQIEHAQPIRLGTTARVWFKCGTVTASAQGLTIWSRLSSSPNDQGKYLYHSGVRLQGAEAEFASVIHALEIRGSIRLDDHSLDRKRRLLEAKNQEKSARPVVKLIHAEAIDPDQILLIEHARMRLRENPEEAKRWLNRARFAMNEEKTRIADAVHHREDVLAVWEYLERSIDLSTIIKVFDRMQKG